MARKDNGQDRYILALDLSLNGSGMVVLKPNKQSIRIVEAVLVDNKYLPTDELPQKLANIYFAVSDLYEKYPITDVVREKGFAKHAGVTQKLYKVQGVVDFAAYCCGVDKVMPEITPTTVKKTITGDGKASKEQVAKDVMKYISRQQREQGITFESNDISDAVAVGVSYCLQKKLIKG